MSWFEVDKDGLAAVLERRGKAFALFELIQNAWDAGGPKVEIFLKPISGVPYATLTVEDWGDGFADLDEAFTMFGRSRRSADPMKRGRFSFGEKLVLSLCRKASIVSMDGGIEFGESRRRLRANRERGTLFAAELRMTREEYDETCEAVGRLIPPVPTFFNGSQLERPRQVSSFRAKLPTELADAEGMLRRSIRETEIEIFESANGCGELLEMGIPVVETGNGYLVNVLQKVPLGMDRDNVTPSYLRTVNALVLNQIHGRLDSDAAGLPWVLEAAGDGRALPDAIASVLRSRFGERAVAATPGDPIANANAEASGYTVVPGGALSGDCWANVRKHGLLKPAGQLFPSPKPDQLEAAQKGKCPACGRAL